MIECSPLDSLDRPDERGRHEQRVVQEGDEQRSSERPTRTMRLREMGWMVISWGG
jgi:hypothetical protein